MTIWMSVFDIKFWSLAFIKSAVPCYIYVSYDEKPGIQTIETSSPDPPLKEGMPNELTSILREYLDFDTLLFCRYEYDRLLNGKEHPASVYLICLSEKGRLILYEDV